MKSPMVTNADYISDKGNYSELQVFQSSAGYYVGTMYNNRDDPEHPFQEPGSRDSDYFRTHDEATRFLNALKDPAAEEQDRLRLTP